MEMPTPCVICNETFDLNEGRCGLTHRTWDTTICDNCHSNQQTQKNRVDEIRQALESKRDNEINIESWTNQLEAIQADIDHSEFENEILGEDLKRLGYKGISDDYHILIDEFY